MSDRRKIDLPDDPAGIDEPHDVLAAEEFAMPARSAGDIPPDPTGIEEPHDVLAAEEFAMPVAGVEHDDSAGFDVRSLFPGLTLALVVLLIVRRRRRK
jgi:MYXO-CTERM domain-containing protein